ncbi:hypothetical protein G6F70_002894 [Rhizopus microsporus]|nr:hypothetical protein G6F71_001632 [Rhizopus microsporus]KAG1201745.1 hypothetical protein G6F70_002894 [Rhizopus microsporus]KAG1213346.1 hypothetical protein G6F69_002907 [Rhizopus microsporus]KAG1235884.1 hypothetical protein G6F67_002432 [Rhizopus microsporus]KAG1266742.1 hypothetical protein G6F68_002485 [Rhizopus microsporus]
MIHNGKYNHSRYLLEHLTVAEKSRLSEKAEDAHVKPSKAVLGFHPEPREVAPSIYDSVRKILINKYRAKYELKNTRGWTLTHLLLVSQMLSSMKKTSMLAVNKDTSVQTVLPAPAPINTSKKYQDKIDKTETLKKEKEKNKITGNEQKQLRCPFCGGTDHSRSSSKLCPMNKSKMKYPKPKDTIEKTFVINTSLANTCKYPKLITLIQEAVDYATQLTTTRAVTAEEAANVAPAESIAIGVAEAVTEDLEIKEDDASYNQNSNTLPNLRPTKEAAVNNHISNVVVEWGDQACNPSLSIQRSCEC